MFISFKKLVVFVFPQQLNMTTILLFVIKTTIVHIVASYCCNTSGINTTTIVHIVASYCCNTSGIKTKITSILTLSFEFLLYS